MPSNILFSLNQFDSEELNVQQANVHMFDTCTNDYLHLLVMSTKFSSFYIAQSWAIFFKYNPMETTGLIRETQYLWTSKSRRGWGWRPSRRGRAGWWGWCRPQCTSSFNRSHIFHVIKSCIYTVQGGQRKYFMYGD